MTNHTLSLPFPNLFLEQFPTARGKFINGVTGARDLHDDEYDVLIDAFADLREARSGQHVLLHGCCYGVDVAAAMFAHNFGQMVIAVLPPDHSRVDRRWVKYSDDYIEIPAGPDGFKRRNAYIVGASQRLRGIPRYPEHHIESRRSGTWQTIRMGWRKGIPVDIHILSEIARRS